MSFGATFLKWPVIRKRLTVEQSGQFRTWGYFLHVAWGPLTFNVQGHFGVIWCTCFKMAGHWKMWLAVERNWVKFQTRGTCNMYMRNLWPFSVPGHLGVIWCTCLQMARNSKTAGCRAEPSDDWGSGGNYNMYMGTFGRLVFNVILGSFGALGSKCAITRKQLAVERNWMKFGTWGRGHTYMWYLWPFSVQCLFWVIWCTYLKNGLYLENDWP